MVRETLLDYFHTVARQEGEYLVYDDGFRPRSYSYADLARAARHFAVLLQPHGVGRGDRIILWSENRPAWVAAFWGCVLRGVAVALGHEGTAEYFPPVQDFGGDPCPICSPMDKHRIPMAEQFWVEGLGKFVDHPGPSEVHPLCRCGLLIYESKVTQP